MMRPEEVMIDHVDDHRLSPSTTAKASLALQLHVGGYDGAKRGSQSHIHMIHAIHVYYKRVDL